MRFRRPNGKSAKLTLGKVDLSASDKHAKAAPKIGDPLTLSDARLLAAEIGRQRARDVDVVADHAAVKRRQRDRGLNSAANTFGTAARDFIKSSPPDRLSRRGHSTADACRLDIGYEADSMFDKSVTLGTAEAKLIYKDISIEDLKDEELMASLRKVMEDAGVDPGIVARLFQSGDAAAAQGSFEGM
jgi:hypothetical protein